MKKAISLGMLLFVAGQGLAQRGGGSGFGARIPAGNGFSGGVSGQREVPRVVFQNPYFGFGPQVTGNFGIPPVGPIPQLLPNYPAANVVTPGLRGFGGRFGFSPYPAYAGYAPALLVSDEPAYGYAAAPNIIVLQPIQMQAPYQPPPEIVRSAVHEYRLPAGATSAPAAGPQPVFTLAMRDGSTRSASVVWFQVGVVHYVDLEGKTEQVPLRAIDGDATERVNREKNLELRLPELHLPTRGR
jgi:hypothetical protein